MPGVFCILSDDPAELTIDQWEALQAAIGGLALLPDVPVRPASDWVIACLTSIF